MNPHILGIDPGMASTGVGLVEILPTGDLRFVSAGVIRTTKSNKKQNIKAADDTFQRAQHIAGKILHIVEKFDIKLICAESMSFPRNASAAAKMAMTWGILATITEERKLPLLQATPQEIKKKLAGAIAASKQDVQKAVQNRLGAEIAKVLASTPQTQHEHAYDALGAILACEDAEAFRLMRTLWTTTSKTISATS